MSGTHERSLSSEVLCDGKLDNPCGDSRLRLSSGPTARFAGLQWKQVPSSARLGSRGRLSPCKSTSSHFNQPVSRVPAGAHVLQGTIEFDLRNFGVWPGQNCSCFFLRKFE